MLKYVRSAEVMYRSPVRPEGLPRALYNGLRRFWEVGFTHLLPSDRWELYLFFVRREGDYVLSHLWQMDEPALTRILQGTPELPSEKEELPVQVSAQNIMHYFRGGGVKQRTESLEQMQFFCAMAPAFLQGVLHATSFGRNVVDVHLFSDKPRFRFAKMGTYITVTLSTLVPFQEVAEILHRLTVRNMSWVMRQNKGEKGSVRSYTLEWFDASESGLHSPFTCLSVLPRNVVTGFRWPREITDFHPECKGDKDVERVAALLTGGKLSTVRFLEMPERYERKMRL